MQRVKNVGSNILLMLSLWETPANIDVNGQQLEMLFSGNGEFCATKFDVIELKQEAQLIPQR